MAASCLVVMIVNKFISEHKIGAWLLVWYFPFRFPGYFPMTGAGSLVHSFLTEHFAVLEPQNMAVDNSYELQNRLSTYFEALKLLMLCWAVETAAKGKNGATREQMRPKGFCFSIFNGRYLAERRGLFLPFFLCYGSFADP